MSYFPQNGLGASPQTNPWKCGPSGCYSFQSPEMNSAIKRLQDTINRFSASPDIGFTPIAVDGVFGAGSLAAFFWALATIEAHPEKVGAADASSASNLIAIVNTPEDVVSTMVPPGTAAADWARNQLAKGANALGLPQTVSAGTSPAPKPKTQAGAAVLDKIQQNKPATNGGIFASIMSLGTPTLVIGGALLLAAGYFMMTPPKSLRSSRIRSARRRSRR